LGLIYKGYMKNRPTATTRQESYSEMSEAMREAPDLDLHRYEKRTRSVSSDSDDRSEIYSSID